MLDHLINLDQCAQLLGVSKSTAYRLAKGQKPPFEDVEKFGSRYMVPYFAFCRRLGLEPNDLGSLEKEGDPLCVKFGGGNIT